MMESAIWIIGAGKMAIDYAKILKNTNQYYDVIGRGKESAALFEKEIDKNVITGGLESFLKTSPTAPCFAIIAVNIEDLFSSTRILVDYGVKNILVEKPAGLSRKEIDALRNLSIDKNARIYVAYNRRFYSSVQKALEIINQDGGVVSFNFEFTEWGHVIEKLPKPKEVLEKWFLGNSTHVVDLAFFMGGAPEHLQTFTSGNLPWHKSASVFNGAGISKKGALFSYQANWDAPGRWGVEILTSKHRIILKPLEKLQILKKGEINPAFIEVDDVLDTQYKPGLYLQVMNFLNNNTEHLCSISEHSDNMKYYCKIANY